MFFPASEWFAAFLLTCAVEVPLVAVLLWRTRSGAAIGLPRLVGLAFFANLASHPLVWFVFTQLYLVGTPEYLLAAEGWAFGIEALFYAVAVPGLAARGAIAVSLIANVASFLVGRLLLHVLPGLSG